MKERPKVGDRVEFNCRGVRIGTVVAIAETGVHFLVETPFTSPIARRPLDIGSNQKNLRISIDNIIRILPKVDPGDTETGVNLV